ncbi:hypothetical protein GCM10022271_11600 [Corallibacter vietnamensis]|uniref:Uncharacterized protein n=1 Tax=Corallibacter vietnamensis TaxID=904130 RepID=A0ABP7H1R8_9FLAO
MDASVAYSVAMALPQEERVKLFNMLKADVMPKAKVKSGKDKTPIFSDDEALEYLFDKLGL